MGQKRPCKRWTRLVEARRMRGLTQRDMAKLTGVQQSHYCDYEAGKLTPGTEKVKSFAVALGVSMDWLLGVDPPEDVVVDGIPLSEEEEALIRVYRSSEQGGREEIERLVCGSQPDE